MNAATRLHGRWFATVAEAAAVLHVDARTVRRAIDGGAIPATRVGQQLRVPVAWLEAQAMRTEPPREGPQPPMHNDDQEDEAEGHQGDLVPFVVGGAATPPDSPTGDVDA